MAAKQLNISINSILSEFSNKNNIDKSTIPENDLFEDLINYIISSNFIKEDYQQYNKVSTGLSQGIDGLILMINGNIIKDESDLLAIGKSEKLNVKIAIIQSTLQSSFNMQKFQSFFDECVKILDEDVIIEPFSSLVSKIFDRDGDYIDQLEDKAEVYLYFVSGKTNHNIEYSILDLERKKFETRESINNNYIISNIEVLQENDIKSEYDKIKKYDKFEITFDKTIQFTSRDKVEISLLTTVKFSALKDLIISTDSVIKDKLFYENVRLFVGDTDVNNAIRNTLINNSDRNYFPYLNNGITILCEEIEKHKIRENTFTLTYPRIINGCQTSNILAKEYLTTPEVIEDVEIVLKIVSTTDAEFKKKIILATNNQNSINKDLQSLNDFHLKIEEYFFGQNIYDLSFERLRGQYSNISPSYRVINIEYIAKSYISIFKMEPHKMKSNAISIIDDLQNSKSIFNDLTTIPDYFYSGLLYYLFNKFISERKINLNSNSADMHMLLAIDQILKTKYNLNTTDKKIEYLKNKNEAENIFKEAADFINSCNYLFERRGFYSAPKTRKIINDITEYATK